MLAGGTAGAQAGTTFGPWGTVIGGAIGGFAGFLGDQQENEAAAAAANEGPQAKANQQLADEAWKQRQFLAGQQENQTAFAQQLADRAMGKGPSLAEAAMRATQDRNLQQQVAAARANRSANAGLASRTNAMIGAQQNQQTVQAAGQAKLAEALAQQQAYANYMAQQQNYAQGLMSAQAGIGSQAAAQNAANQQYNDGIMGGLMGTAGQLVGGIGGMFGKGGGGGGGLGGGTSMGSSPRPMSRGGIVEGEAPVKGDNPANDIVDAKLSPGEMVVPRTVVAAGPKAVTSFAESLLKSKQDTSANKKQLNFAAVLAAKRGANGK